ncbi:UDP-N-acetylmuramoyl-L-alanine--D-glutamate ligase [Methylovirgula ligni]|uniref:UDP-N-acetylmuramoylalanine--D-glutamate ligase n=1 Tax=Methylovirgula ligni TaxID=569860 RepID=A0A3D9YWV5_9HYPH|nr:UDP-N-acetylmuramoyl-L-alanine--D-glutamate ligase [Methylovirgula ligni]QAY96132.1 UDP-N-acetylmuramoyl-L-alanine--D-glutamate ligase [Methylovirgula ligni]REF86181.1 UDP-N-acetylmuramoylalanine--D-glutamate ligase [Methylovirgula ligni]
MTPVTSFAGKRVAVFGLGASGLVSAQALVAGGADVAVWDDHRPGREKAAALGLKLEDLVTADLTGYDSLILSPGVPLTHPYPHWVVVKAQAAGVEIIGDIELFVRERAHIAPDAPLIAITGTNGKSTTTALVAHLYQTFGYEVEVGGNIGTPILALNPPAKGRVHVIECSSFQIDLAPSLNPSFGLLLNITVDHLDRHGTMEHYAEIKERLVAKADVAIIGVDDDICAGIAQRLRGQGRAIVPISILHPAIPDGIVLEGTRLVRKSGGQASTIADLAGIPSLRGTHNGQNAAAAVAALGPHGFELELVQEGLRSFPGLAHRMEEIGRRGKVLYINDSKATNADAAEKALQSLDDIYWILGGRAKEGGIGPLEPLFPKVAKAYLIGEAAEPFAKVIGEAIPYEFCGTIERAVDSATRDAEASTTPSPIVLLSPACASFDQFPNFEKRGDKFREVVLAKLAEPPKT